MSNDPKIVELSGGRRFRVQGVGLSGSDGARPALCVDELPVIGEPILVGHLIERPAGGATPKPAKAGGLAILEDVYAALEADRRATNAMAAPKGAK